MFYDQIKAIHRSLQAGAMLASVILFSFPAHAAGTGMPWEGPLDQILQSIEGPVARIVAVIIITLTGLTLAFGETSGGFRKLLPRLLLLWRRRGAVMVTTGLTPADETLQWSVSKEERNER